MHQHALAPDFDSWSEVISGSFVPLDTEPVGPASRGFRGAVDLHDLGGVALSTVTAASHTVQRTERLIQDGGTSLFKLSLQLCGRGLLIQDGREVVLEPGRMALYDTSRPYTLTFDRDFSCRVLMFPHADLGLPVDQVAQLTATDLGAPHGMGTVMGGLLDGACQVLPGVEDTVGARLVHHAVDLLGTVVTDVLGTPRVPRGLHPSERPSCSSAAPDPPEDDRARRRAAVVRFVEEHLGEPGLDPERIAQAHFLSVRSLHQLFRGTGTTVAALVRDRRLERCREQLVDPAHAHRPVAVVGATWGFADPAHFSRAFRDRFGQSPARYRQAALEV